MFFLFLLFFNIILAFSNVNKKYKWTENLIITVRSFRTSFYYLIMIFLMFNVLILEYTFYNTIPEVMDKSFLFFGNIGNYIFFIFFIFIMFVLIYGFIITVMKDKVIEDIKNKYGDCK